MKLEASSYDNVEWNPTPIEPGTFINKPKKPINVKLGNKKKLF